MDVLDFEKPLYDLEQKIISLKENAGEEELRILKGLENQHKKLLRSVYSKLTPWQKVQIARHALRPKALDYIQKLFTDLFLLEGDRISSKDESVLVYIAQLAGDNVMVIGQEKGHDLASRQKHNFGMVSPSGYRKIQRCVELASRWHLPIITFIDTPGAYPCKEAEEFGQAEAIAKCMAAFFKAQTPIITCVIGEGGSGGAMAIGVANVVMMLENSVYSIASPEAVSSILWKNSDNKEFAAQALKITAADLKQAGYVDLIINEPEGGAHRHRDKTIEAVGIALKDQLSRLIKLDKFLITKMREDKFIRFSKISV